MERTDASVLSDSWERKRQSLIVVKDGRLNFLTNHSSRKNWAIVGLATDYFLNGPINADLRVMSFPACDLVVTISGLEKSSLRPLINRLSEDALQSVQVQFSGKAYDLVDEEGVNFEVRPGRLAIRIYSLNRTFRKFVIRYREKSMARQLRGCGGE